MNNEQLKLLMKSLGEQIFENSTNPTGTVAMLISETVKLRDKLKDETGYILTVSDTQTALNALEKMLKKEAVTEKLSSEQKLLAQIWYDRLTIFNK
ncbi:MAG: hypothetical protein PHU88_08395 [candidate division Zixibacteria bacterium]|nr:hypothetical protein [candidate division Zixibacteria bacterium]MDD5425109.1 hypothetical protein [candidate division Zixibacteria bacterium]